MKKLMLILFFMVTSTCCNADGLTPADTARLAHLDTIFPTYLDSLQGLNPEARRQLIDYYTGIGANGNPRKSRYHKLGKKLREASRRTLRATFDRRRPALVKQLAEHGIIVSEADELHHIVPLRYLGVNEWWNLIPLPKAQHEAVHESRVFLDLFPLAARQE